MNITLITQAKEGKNITFTEPVKLNKKNIVIRSI